LPGEADDSREDILLFERVACGYQTGLTEFFTDIGAKRTSPNFCSLSTAAGFQASGAEQKQASDGGA